MPTDEQRTLRPFLQFPLWAAAKGGRPSRPLLQGPNRKLREAGAGLCRL